jgi:hypothetical protein
LLDEPLANSHGRSFYLAPPPASGAPPPNVRNSHEGLCRTTGGVLAAPLSAEEAAGVAAAAAAELVAGGSVRLGLWRADGTASGGPSGNLVAADGRAVSGAAGVAARLNASPPCLACLHFYVLVSLACLIARPLIGAYLRWANPLAGGTTFPTMSPGAVCVAGVGPQLSWQDDDCSGGLRAVCERLGEAGARTRVLRMSWPKRQPTSSIGRACLWEGTQSSHSIFSCRADALPEDVAYVGCFAAVSPAALLPQPLGPVFSLGACAERARQAGLRWAASLKSR